MTSEIRANTLKNRVGLGTVSFTNTGPVVSGIVTANTLRLPDSTSGSLGRLQLGNGLHLSLYHNGSNSFLVNNNGYLSIQSQAGVNGIFIARNAEVNLYFGPSVRLQTSSSGVTINRDLDVDGHTNLDNVSIAGVTTFSTSPVVPNGGYYKGIINSGSQQKIVGGYISGTDTLRLGESMYLSSTGLGIGVASPTQKLDVDGDISITDKIIHTGDTNTAIRFPSADTITAETAGNERLRITNDGKIGIGINNPSAALHISNSVAEIRLTDSDGDGDYSQIISGATGNLFLSADAGNGGNNSRISMLVDNDEKLRITSTGNVGINQSSPRTTLDVSGYVYLGAGGQLQITGSAGAKGLQLAGADDGTNIIGTMGSSGEHLAFRTASNERMRLLVGGPHLLLGGSASVNEITETSTNSGLVIGNTSMGNGGLAIINSTSGTGRIYFGDATGSDTARNRGQINYYHNGDYMMFATAGTERIRISSSGLVNIGAGSAVSGLSPLLHLHKNASNSTAYLHITNNTTGITNNDGFLLGINGVGDCLVFNKDSTPIRFATQGLERLRITSGGSFGFNNSNPQYTLDIVGDQINLQSNASASNAVVRLRGQNNSTGGAIVAMNGSGASGPLELWNGGVKSFSIGSDNTPTFFSPAVAWHEGPAVLEASNGYAEIFFRSTGSTHGTSITGTWSVGKLAGTSGFGILKNGMTGGGAVRADAPLSISNAGDITIGKQLLTPKRPAFFVTMNGGNQTTTAANRLPFDTVVHNEGGHYQTSGSNAYNFVCPVAGYYFFGAQVWLKHGSGTGNHARWEIWRDTTIVALAGWHQNGVNLNDMQSSATVTIYCDAGAKVYVEADYALTYWRGSASQPHTFFHGFLIG